MHDAPLGFAEKKYLDSLHLREKRKKKKKKLLLEVQKTSIK